MKSHSHFSFPLVAALRLVTLVNAKDPVYVTDLKLFSSLAPCAASAITYGINAITASTSACGEGEKQMHSCVCSHTADFNSISSRVSTEVISSCLGTSSASVTDDISSASLMLKQYCSQDATITFSEPEHKVNAYITELSEIATLPFCAQSALSYAVANGVGWYKCPEDASLYAPCVCGKGGVAAEVTSSLSSVARTTCSNAEDASYALDFFAGYCGMNDGTTSFPTLKNPPGDMTYHITGLPQFKSLRGCAQLALSSAVLIQTHFYCASAPQALASCVCLKSGVFDRVSSTMTDEVKYECDSTATADVASAIEVLDYYCSAADGKVVASVEVPPAEVSTTQGGSSEPTNPPSSESRSSAPKETGGSGSSGDSETSGSGDSEGEGPNQTSGESGVNRTAIIAAAVLGAFLLLAAVAGIIFYVRRKRRRDAKGEELPSAPAGPVFQEYSGKPELAGPDPIVSRPGTGHVDVETLKAELPTSASYQELPTPTSPNPAANAVFPNRRSAAVSDMSPTDSLRPELPTTVPAMATAPPMPHLQAPQEVVSPVAGQQSSAHFYGQQGQGVPMPYPVSPQSQRGSPANGFPAYPPPMPYGWGGQPQQHQQPGVGWQSGPVEVYEMDSNVNRRQG
ncbi:hypothetical protein HJFPF1_09998 [Paramyrothecium foliicola]|nr:hypothetical protein HJFPF1_09998 [Paramyrothecium foliicola]